MRIRINSTNLKIRLKVEVHIFIVGDSRDRDSPPKPALRYVKRDESDGYSAAERFYSERALIHDIICEWPSGRTG